MKSVHELKVLAIWATAALLLAGCGDSSGDDTSGAKDAKPRSTEGRKAVDSKYQSQMRAIDDRLNATMGALFQSGTFTSKQVSDAQAQLDRSAEEMEQIDPPANVGDAHAKYLAGIRGFGPILIKLEAAQGDPERIRAHLADPQYSSVIGGLEKAKFRYEQAGYKF